MSILLFRHLYSLRGIWAYFKGELRLYTHGALFNYARRRASWCQPMAWDADQKDLARGAWL